MKNILLIIWVFASFTKIVAQNLDTIKKIEIKYGYGDQCFPRKGIYSRSEKFEIKRLNKNDFQIVNYIKYSGSSGKDRKTFSKDSIAVNLKYNKIENTLLTNLLKNLNNDQQNFNWDFLKSKLISPKKDLIKKMLKETVYKREDWDKEDWNELCDSIMKFDKFVAFLSTIDLTPQQIITIGYHNEARIKVFSEKNVIVYSMPFMDNGHGQPFHKSFNNNYQREKSFVNLEVNEILRKIIPKKTITYDVFSFDNITKDYIKWYLKNN